MVNECRLTTNDNPFDPFDEYDDWRRFDEEKGYYSNSRLGRILEKNGISIFSDLSQQEIDEATEKAIDEIILYDPLNIYKKATKQVAIS